MAAMLICCVLICGMVAWFMFGERAVLRYIKAKEEKENGQTERLAEGQSEEWKTAG